MKNKICKIFSFLVTMTLLAGLMPVIRVNAAEKYKMTLITDQPGCKVEYLGKKYESGSEISVEAGTEVKLFAKTSGDYLFKSAESPDVTVNKNGSIGYILIMPEKNVTITFHFEGPGPYDMELNTVTLDTSEAGYTPADVRKALTAKKLGSGTMYADNISVKLSSGDNKAFTVTQISGGSMSVKGNTYDVAYVAPVAGLAIGSYEAVVSLYYDQDGAGTEYSPEFIDSAYVRFNVITNITHKMTIITDNSNSTVTYNQVKYKSGQTVDVHEGEFVSVYGNAPSGYTFAYAESADVKVNKNGSICYQFNMPEKDITVYFYFDSNVKHTVTFETGDGSAVSSQSVADCKTAKKPAEPTLEGYVFWDWYTDPECTEPYVFSDPVTEDITLYAYWTKNINGFGFDAVGTVKDPDGNRKLNVRYTDVLFELELADIDVSVSPFYTDKYFTELAEGELEKGKEYYFYINLEDVEGVEGKPLVYYSYDILPNLEIYSEGGDIVPTELSHSPGGKSVSILFKYVLDEGYKGGWSELYDSWYYVDSNGEAATGWKQVGGKWYYFDEIGVMKTGWVELNGIWYYLEGSGAMVKGWKEIGGKWYYFDNSGAMKKGWVQSGSTWYFMDNNGAMVTGWKDIGGKWYYFDNTGAMKTGWVQSGSTWYFMDNSGAMVTGWKSISGKWYFFEDSGAMKTGWLKQGGNWYYLMPSGEMATGTVTVDGVDYEFTDSGIWVED